MTPPAKTLAKSGQDFGAKGPQKRPEAAASGLSHPVIESSQVSFYPGITPSRKRITSKAVRYYTARRHKLRFATSALFVIPARPVSFSASLTLGDIFSHAWLCARIEAFVGWALPTKKTVFRTRSDVAGTMIKAPTSPSPFGRGGWPAQRRDDNRCFLLQWHKRTRTITAGPAVSPMPPRSCPRSSESRQIAGRPWRWLSTLPGSP